jgi:chemotaxis protein CheX
LYLSYDTEMVDLEDNILVVDDEADLREVMMLVLNNSDYLCRIKEAADGAEALKLIYREKFDIVITDLKMPVLDGNGLIESLKLVPDEFHPDHIMVVTGYPDRLPSKTNMSLLRKPFTADQLVKFVGMVSHQPKLAGKQREKLDTEFLNPFIEATKEVMEVMTKTPAEKDFICIKSSNESRGDITGIIPIQSEKYLGSMAITFPEDVYLKIVSSMMGEEFTEINAENRDGVGEICNQICGNARALLTKLGYKLEMTQPTIITGENHQVSHTALSSQVLAVFFRTEYGSFVVECVISRRS